MSDVLEEHPPAKCYRSPAMAALVKDYERRRQAGEKLSFLMPPLPGRSLLTTGKGSSP